MKQGNRTQGDVWGKLLICVRVLFFVLSAAIFVLILFFRENMQRVWDAENKLSVVHPFFLLLLGIGIVAGAGAIWYRVRESVGRRCGKYVGYIAGIGSVFLFFLQLYISCQIYFYPGWDAGLLVEFAERMESDTVGEMMDGMSGYFSLAPNNIMLTIFFRRMIRFSRVIGIFTENSSLMMLITVQCLISSITVYLIYQCVKKVTKSDAAAFCGWLAGVFFVGLSPWMVFPYSDATGMLFPILTAALYILWGDKYLPVKWILMAGVSVLGYHIKPQTFIAFLAILIVEGIRMLREKKAWRQRLLCFTAAFLMACAAYYACEQIKDGFKEEIYFEPEASLGILHYAMMGLNEENTGMYSFQDVEYSMSFDTAEERNQANMLKIKERIDSYGFSGLMKHWTKKTIANYGDSTFGWGGQGGGFYGEIYPPKNETVSPFLRSVYYSDGAYFPLYFSARQMCWLLILLFMGGAGLRKTMSKVDYGADVLTLTILGLTLFEMIFEGHAKYLYTHAPIFVMLATIGLHRYFALVTNAVSHRGFRYLTKVS